MPNAPGVPDSELQIYYPPTEVDKVLEVAAGRIRLLRTRVGDAITIRSFIPKVEVMLGG